MHRKSPASIPGPSAATKARQTGLQRFTPTSEVAIEMLSQKVNGLPLQKFVEKVLYDCIKRKKEEETRRQTEGFAGPVQ